MNHETTTAVDQIFDRQVWQLQEILEDCLRQHPSDAANVLNKLNRFEKHHREIIERIRQAVSGAGPLGHGINTTYSLSGQNQAHYPQEILPIVRTPAHYEQVIDPAAIRLDVNRSNAYSSSVYQTSTDDSSLLSLLDFSHLSQESNGFEDEHGESSSLAFDATTIRQIGSDQAMLSLPGTVSSQLASTFTRSEELSSTGMCAMRKSEAQSKRLSQSKKPIAISSELEAEVHGSLDDSNRKQMQQVCRFYLAIGSLDSLAQLRGVLKSLEYSEGPAKTYDLKCIKNLLSRYDNLRGRENLIAFQRRILLIQINECHANVVAELENTTAVDRRTRHSGKSSVIAYDKLMIQAFPDLPQPAADEDWPDWRIKYKDQRKHLRNRVTAGKNWRLAVNRFGLGIILLFPSGGMFRIQNQSYETLHEGSCRVLLDLIERKRGFMSQAAKHLTPFVQSIYDGGCSPITVDIQYLYDLHPDTSISTEAIGPQEQHFI